MSEMKYYNDPVVKISVPIPENYRDCILLLQSDYYRIHGRTAGLLRMWLFGLKEPSFMYMFWHRLSQVKGWVWLLAKAMHRHYMFKYGLMIASSTKIGYGFFIGHPQGIIINHTAVIGNNVNVSQFTTIGSNKQHAAVIGDNVYVGPSVCMIDDVYVGSNATVGAGAVVTKNVSENAVVAGNPAHEIHAKVCPGKYIANRWPIPDFTPPPANLQSNNGGGCVICGCYIV